MTLKQQPQIRVIDPESECFSNIYDVEKWDYLVNEVYTNDWIFSFSEVQELTPLSHDGVRIGIGDEVTHGPRKVTVNGFWVCEDSDVVKLHVSKCGSIWETDITDHKPLTEMKEDGVRVTDNEGNEYEYEIDNDKPTIDNTTFNLTHNSDTVRKLMQNQSKITKALADAGIINLEDNNE